MSAAHLAGTAAPTERLTLARHVAAQTSHLQEEMR